MCCASSGTRVAAPLGDVQDRDFSPGRLPLPPGGRTCWQLRSSFGEVEQSVADGLGAPGSSPISGPMSGLSIGEGSRDGR